MKKTRLLNSPMSDVVSRMGHGASLTLCDAGLPVPRAVPRIDLAIERGYPTLIRTLDALLSELQVEAIVLAHELHGSSQTTFDGLMEVFRSHGMMPAVTEVDHEMFKSLVADSEAVIRTGECTPYANIILRSGVAFL